jgi:hypothetical protein
MLHSLRVGAARSVHYSSDGEYLAIGLKNGEFLLLNASNLKLISKKRDRNKSIADIRLVGLFHETSGLSIT